MIKDILSTFGLFAGIAKEALPAIIDGFAEKHPELIDRDDPNAPPPAPVGDVDPAVRAAIAKGNA